MDWLMRRGFQALHTVCHRLVTLLHLRHAASYAAKDVIRDWVYTEIRRLAMIITYQSLIAMPPVIRYMRQNTYYLRLTLPLLDTCHYVNTLLHYAIVTGHCCYIDGDAWPRLFVTLHTLESHIMPLVLR